MALQVAYMKMAGFLSKQEEPLKSYIIHIGIAIFVHLDDRYLCLKQKSTKTNKQTAGFVTTYLIGSLIDFRVMMVWKRPCFGVFIELHKVKVCIN